MEFSKLLEELDKLNFPKDQYAITSSGPMAARKIREARDLDVIVTDQLWNKLVGTYPISEKPLGPVMEISELVQVIGDLKPDLEVRPNDLQIKEADIIDNYPFVKLEDVIKFKTALGREKDLKDIELINQYLSPNNI